MDGLFRDLRHAARSLLKSPGFTLVAMLTLALGIGVNSAMFSVLNAVLLRPLPYPAAERIVALSETFPQRGEGLTPAAPRNFLDWKEQSRSFSALAAYRQQNLILTGAAEPEQLEAVRASAELFAVFGVAPALGRGFTADDDAPGAVPGVMLGHGLWQQRFAGDPAAVGTTIQLNSEAYVVLGVMPAGFRLPGVDAALWTNRAWPESAREARGAKMLTVVGRLRPGVTLADARTELAGVMRGIGEAAPEMMQGWEAHVAPLQEQVVGQVRTPLYVLMGAVVFVLLIACANVANLFLARAAARRKEMAVRSAIGASRWLLARRVLAEGVLLALAGAGLGLLLAHWATRLLAAAAPDALPRAQEVGVDAGVVAFTLAVALLAVLVFSLAPVLQGTRVDIARIINDGRKGTAGTARNRTRNALVTAEVALSLLLLIGAGLMLKSFVRLSSVHPGFDAERVLTAHVPLPTVRYDTPEKQAAFFDALAERVRALPGVQAVGLTGAVPLSGFVPIRGIWKEGDEALPVADIQTAYYSPVDAGALHTLRVPLRQGRLLEPGDRAGGAPVAVVNETFARTQFPAGDALGGRIRLGDPEGELVEIVGVVADVKQAGLREPAPPQVYRPHQQAPTPGLTLLVRTAGDPAALAGAVRAEVRALDPEQPLGTVSTLEETLAGSIAQSRFGMLLLAAFAGVALLLAVIGIYGVIAYTVAQRTQEFGIKLALGARPAALLGRVVAEAMRVAGLGIVIGAVAALLATRVLETLMYEVSATDPLVYLQLTMLIALVALVAVVVPARRAMRVDPVVALRTE